ncbi:tyrosine-type recombinase/integrase [Sphingobacteriaceae bacterium WQ 2009]|uniref:Tyrosine-type recombinase/integrase n=1 Tax=Rhinopithecimicrobium faecis TaxID=2820698 RepID=A0A8T4HAQ7_9SPHI|nr:tyrosine-type recombinase/integrase [Sphingobacteriaceae bacterium WQ 2009]
MLQEQFSNYLQYEKRYSPLTLQAYAHEVEQLLQFLEQGKVEAVNFTFKEARQYFAWQVQAGKSATTVNRGISALRTYYKFLQREGAVQANPIQLIKALKTPKKLPVVVEKEKLVSLLDTMPAEDASFEEQRDKIVLELLFGTGIRLAELLHIQERDIDFYSKNIHIFGKRNKERLMPINQTLYEELKKYITAKNNLLVHTKTNFLIVTKDGKPAYAKLIYRIVQKQLSQISTQKKKSPHILRHTFATALLDNGADLNAIKELLGHAGLAATQVYTHNSAERLKSIYKQAHPKA